MIRLEYLARPICRRLPDPEIEPVYKYSLKKKSKIYFKKFPQEHPVVSPTALTGRIPSRIHYLAQPKKDFYCELPRRPTEETKENDASGTVDPLKKKKKKKTVNMERIARLAKPKPVVPE